MDMRTSEAGHPAQKTLDKTDARQAVTTGTVRYVLAISLVLCAIVFAVLYFVYMA